MVGRNILLAAISVLGLATCLPTLPKKAEPPAEPENEYLVPTAAGMEGIGARMEHPPLRPQDVGPNMTPSKR